MAPDAGRTRPTEAGSPVPTGSAEFASLAQALQADQDRGATGEVIVGRLLAVVGDADMVSLTVSSSRRQRRHRTLASTDEVAARADALQYELDEGPCLDALAGTPWLRSGDIGSDPRWPGWGPRAAELGPRSVLSIQMLDHDLPIGALNIYSTSPGGFVDPDTVDLALTVSVHAATALASATQLTNLRTALNSRHAIGMAQGVLMERFDLTEHQSFDLLRRLASENGTKLRDLADRIVETRTLP